MHHQVSTDAYIAILVSISLLASSFLNTLSSQGLKDEDIPSLEMWYQSQSSWPSLYYYFAHFTNLKNECLQILPPLYFWLPVY